MEPTWEQARIEEALRLCDQTIERIGDGAGGDASRLLAQVKTLRGDLLHELRRVRQQQQQQRAERQ